MEQIKELTKRLIANSFKELLLQNSFEKITIKMITDHANVIRPTDTLSDMFTSFYKEAASRNLKIVKETKLSVDTVARYYSSGLITVLKMLVGDNGSESLEDFLYGYRYLISHALYDI